MIRTVEKGKTLLIDGPASVTVTSGKVEAFGYPSSSTNRIVIREGKRLPLAVEEKAVFDISVAEKATVEEVDGNTIPASWFKSYEEVMGLQAKPIVVMVLGTVDSGKTSFCTYLTNKLLEQKKKVAVLDGDLGQSDIGPPCTVAYTVVARPMTDLFNLQAKNAIFIGATSPSGLVDKVVEALTSIKKEILTHSPDVVIINTDGWTEGEEALKYKVRLVEEMSPNMVFIIQQRDELTALVNALEEFTKLAVESPLAIGQRSMEKRRNLRELGYQKYLRNAKIQSFPQGWLKIEDNELFGLNQMHPNTREAGRIFDLLGMKPLHFAERGDRISIIIGKRRWINTENLKKVEEATKKKVIVMRKGEEEGLLMALCNDEGRFLGIGVLQEIEYLRKTIKILTPVSKKIAIAIIGKVRLDKNLKEIPVFGEDIPSEFSVFSKLF